MHTVGDRTTAGSATGSAAAKRLSAGGTSVTFDRVGDRWRHVVSAAGGFRAESVEGPDAAGHDPRWPASPVLAEVTLMDTPAGSALVGVGRAGRSHFSASITPHPTHPDTLVFDVACRLQEPPGSLGSTYRVGDGRATIRIPASDAGDSLPRTVRWRYTVGPGGLHPEV